ncbi:hypothetical protein BJ138DRAFT_1104634 [Hygrophoropsis aurantiaca]|uniref:Uncharacterized protein n=1 Tax=Hygrophoropsis aurantiaca TaxID=72124 RepID=A0ACB8A1L9_9AGAM|nr:hypothetical protein BJ138DRAFT_1104634 [Hygrophoropsis aurantiaca]
MSSFTGPGVPGDNFDDLPAGQRSGTIGSSSSSGNGTRSSSNQPNRPSFEQACLGFIDKFKRGETDKTATIISITQTVSREVIPPAQEKSAIESYLRIVDKYESERKRLEKQPENNGREDRQTKDRDRMEDEEPRRSPSIEEGDTVSKDPEAEVSTGEKKRKANLDLENIKQARKIRNIGGVTSSPTLTRTNAKSAADNRCPRSMHDRPVPYMSDNEFDDLLSAACFKETQGKPHNTTRASKIKIGGSTHVSLPTKHPRLELEI